MGASEIPCNPWGRSASMALRLACLLALLVYFAEGEKTSAPGLFKLDATLARLAELAAFPTSTFLQLDATQSDTAGAQEVQQALFSTQSDTAGAEVQPEGGATLPGGLDMSSQPMHEFPMQWNPYLATMQHPFQLGNQMMQPGLAGFPFPYNGYYPYFNPHPFLQTPHTPPSPLGDPL